MQSLSLGIFTARKTISPISSYRLHRNGYLVPKSLASRFLKPVIAMAIILLGVFYVDETSIAGRYGPASEIGTDRYSKDYWLYYDYISKQNKRLTEKDIKAVVRAVMNQSSEYRIPASIILAIIKIESNFNVHAISTSSAMGLMQILPSAHRDKIGSKELFNIDDNVKLGTMILLEYYKLHGNWNSALLRYNGSLQNPKGYDSNVLKAKTDIEKAIQR
jgi:soluble lytic murein transglycosylase-like protein